jgi:hypothetical protein
MTFLISNATIAVTIMLVFAGLAFVPQTRYLLARAVRAIPIEISLES